MTVGTSVEPDSVLRQEGWCSSCTWEAQFGNSFHPQSSVTSHVAFLNICSSGEGEIKISRALEEGNAALQSLYF